MRDLDQKAGELPPVNLNSAPIVIASNLASQAMVRASDPKAVPIGNDAMPNPGTVIAERLSAAAGYGGSGTAVVSGAAMEVQKYLGLTPGEWQILFGLGGLLIAAAGFAFNAWLGWRRDQREERYRGLQ